MATKTKKSKRRVVTNPYYGLVDMTSPSVEKGRPKKSEGARPTVTKSVRLPPEVWKRLKDQAEREGKTLHAAMRQAALIWLQS